MKRLVNWHVPFVSLVSTIGLILFSVLLALLGTAQARSKITLLETRWLGSWWERVVHHPLLYVLARRVEAGS